jgi:hypothetical protein
VEQLVLVLLVLLVGLVNALIRWSRQRAAPPPEVPPAPPPVLDLPPAARVVVRSPEARVPTRPPAATLPGPRRWPARRGLGTRADVRRAIVALTILGPCRAREGEAEVRTPGPAGL